MYDFGVYKNDFSNVNKNILLSIFLSLDDTEKASQYIRILKIGRRTHHYMSSNEIRNDLKQDMIIVDNIYYSNIDSDTLLIKGHNDRFNYDITLMSCEKVEIKRS